MVIAALPSKKLLLAPFSSSVMLTTYKKALVLHKSTQLSLQNEIYNNCFWNLNWRVVTSAWLRECAIPSCLTLYMQKIVLVQLEEFSVQIDCLIVLVTDKCKSLI